MSKQLIAVNVVLAGVAILFAVLLTRDLRATRSLPPPPVRKAAAPAAPETAEDPAAQPAADRLAGYNVIVSKYLFAASRSETQIASPAAPPPPPPPPRPMLLGVVVDGAESRAYLEDPATKRVIGYKVGDPVAGGRLERVSQDRVQITGRSDGTIDVLLRDPAKPRPAPPPEPAAGQPPQAGPQQGQGLPPGRMEQQQQSQPPGQQPPRPIPPRAVRRLTPEQREADQ